MDELDGLNGLVDVMAGEWMGWIGIGDQKGNEL